MYEMFRGSKFTMSLLLYFSLSSKFYLINTTAAFNFYYKL